MVVVKIMGIFHDFFAQNYLFISNITWKMALSSKLPRNFFSFNPVHNLITFSIVFTNKNRGELWAPPPPPTLRSIYPRSKQRYHSHTFSHKTCLNDNMKIVPNPMGAPCWEFFVGGLGSIVHSPLGCLINWLYVQFPWTANPAISKKGPASEK